MSSDSSSISFPLTPIEVQIKRHAILMSTGFLILLPLGVLLVRYARAFTNRWWLGHATIQFLVSGPVILAGWAMGHHATDQLFTGGHFVDPHKRIGLSLLVLYLVQLLLGAFIHYIKPKSGRRPPQNYLHAVLGLAILALAAYQVNYGITIEWPMSTGNIHPIPGSARKAWMGLVIVFWGLYAIGMVFLPRQLHRENVSRIQKSPKDEVEG